MQYVAMIHEVATKVNISIVYVFSVTWKLFDVSKLSNAHIVAQIHLSSFRNTNLEMGITALSKRVLDLLDDSQSLRSTYHLKY